MQSKIWILLILLFFFLLSFRRYHPTVATLPRSNFYLGIFIPKVLLTITAINTYMAQAKVKQKGTSFPDIFEAVPIGAGNSESARKIWMSTGFQRKLSYDTFNRLLTKLANTVYEKDGEKRPLVCRRQSGVSYLYWRETVKFPEDVRVID